MKFLLLAVVFAIALIETSSGSPTPNNNVKINGGEFSNFGGFSFKRKRDNIATIIGGEFHDFGDIKGRRKRGSGDNIVTIKGGEFHDFGDIKGRKKRGSGDNYVKINGGEFSDFGFIGGKREIELSRVARACRINGGDYTGLSYQERANLKARCKVVGGNFGDMRRSLNLATSNEDNVKYVQIIRIKGDKDDDEKDDENDLEKGEMIIESGNHEGPGKGVGSLSDITRAKNHLITNGAFSSFGDLKG